MKYITLILLIAILFPIVSAEQVVFNNDEDISIIDNWKDVSGVPLTSATCTWYLYSEAGIVLQSGSHSEIAPGIFNFTISQITTLGTYPLLFNCTKDGYNGISTKDSIRIVDEISEDFKDSIDQINLTTEKNNELNEEINITTHMTYDLLSDELNATLTSILNNTDFSKEYLINISSSVESILDNTDLIITKWGSDDADEIINDISSLNRKINNLQFSFEYVSSGELQDKVDNIVNTAKSTYDKLNIPEEVIDIWTWMWYAAIGLIVIVILISIFKPKKKETWQPNNLIPRR